jgi:hypothetical protein
MADYWRGRANLSVGQEGIFFLQTDPASDFSRQIQYGLPIGKQDLHVKGHTRTLRALVKMYADPHSALIAENARDRQFAALALLARYRASRPHLDPNAHVREPIPADESKWILDTLAQMKWTDPPLDAEGTVSLPHVFWQLQLTEKDGWKQPQPQANEDANEVMANAVAKWFKEHAGKYRIERLVAKSTGMK